MNFTPNLLSKFLVPLDWTLWAVLVGALLYALVMILADRRAGAQTSPSLGILLAGLGLVFSAASGLLLHWLAQMQSLTGLVVMTLLFAWPLGPLCTKLVAPGLSEWKRSQPKRTGDRSSAS